MKILVTGCAGFIGFNLIKKINELTDWEIWGIDNLRYRNDEDEEIKFKRWQLVYAKNNWILDMNYKAGLHKYLDSQKFDIIIHLAALTGVRDSINKSGEYISNNINIFHNLLEYYKSNPAQCIIYASSSSVYGNSDNMNEDVTTDEPLNPYAFTKKSNELLAEVYNYLYGIPLVGLRFFTVYGPWGRTDMSYYKWTKAIIEGKPIDLFGTGEQKRDFTYIDNITEGIVKVIDGYAALGNQHLIYNMGNHHPVSMNWVITQLETIIGKKAIINVLPFESGDAIKTFNKSLLFDQTFNYEMNFPIDKGLELFVEWYREYSIKK